MYLNYNLESILPEYIVQEKPELIEFLHAYLDWLNQPGNPSNILNRLTEYRDLDLVAEDYLQYLQREVGISIPKNIRADKRKLYKNVVDIYLSKGSTPSYQALFNLIFNDEIELFFPRVDILKPSDGKWDATNSRWTNDDGKLSVKKFIQDSRYYQSFSYVIKTGQTIDYWRDAVKKLLHPAGFAFFGQVAIFTNAAKKMPTVQPGRAPVDDTPTPVIGPVVRVPVTIFSQIDLNFELSSTVDFAVGPTWSHIDKYKFLNPEENSTYADYTLGQAKSGGKLNRSIASVINISTSP